MAARKGLRPYREDGIEKSLMGITSVEEVISSELTMVEVILSILALVLILSLGWGGTMFGVFYELTSSLLLFFAMMVTMRYWYEATGLVESVLPGAGAYGAFGAYWALFLVGCCR
jgi:hypothetical protein